MKTTNSSRAGRIATNHLANLEAQHFFNVYRSGAIDRCDIFKVLGALGLTGFGMPMMDQGSLAADELKMIIWEGHADDQYRIPLEEANDCVVSLTEAGTGDEMFVQIEISNGTHYDKWIQVWNVATQG